MPVSAAPSHLSFPDFNGRILFDVPMKEYTSLKIGGMADVMVFPKDEYELADIFRFASNKEFPVFVFGKGTNLLVRDNGIRGVVINLSDGLKEISWPEEGCISAGEARGVVGAGVRLADLVNRCAGRGLSGLEFADGIPGTVGGAVYMNAGAYGGEMKDVVEKVAAVDFYGKKHIFNKSALKFSYRKCELPENVIITKAYLKLKKDASEEIKRKIKEFRARRKTTQAINLPNAGSIFKNPQGLYAGMLIEESGLKGVRVGDAQISGIHGNYIVNLGNATAKDVLTLIAMARDKVFREKGILLETEIKVVGED
ncbi:MAG: UDP-N-acetylmuramate dehydrogenase [Deltaproteobacteria bacterium]|nr:UDP-N-acetylmuramate dehydrogenase [Deltaproteobacteria bacterium]